MRRGEAHRDGCCKEMRSALGEGARLTSDSAALAISSAASRVSVGLPGASQSEADWPPLRLCTPLRPPRLVPLTNGTAKRASASECLPSVLRAIEGSLALSFILAWPQAAPSVSRERLRASDFSLLFPTGAPLHTDPHATNLHMKLHQNKTRSTSGADPRLVQIHEIAPE